MSTKPLYEQLADKLTRYIQDGRLKPGDRLPTEAELGEMFGVSRITVRQGLAILTRNGLIERFPSRGSFVLERKNTGSWELNSLNDLVQLGKDTSTKVARWELVAPPAEIAEFFASDEPVYKLQAVRYKSAVPLYFAENYVLRSIGERLGQQDLETRTMVEMLTSVLNVPIKHAQEEISMADASAEMAKQLWIKESQAVIVQRIDLFDVDDKPVQSGKGWWRSEHFKRRFTLNYL
ncbi:GntR family transcriptional regulator [Alcaligenes ammonioxydans]|uniref:GntR family transcriptional regulator n=1 Tax=Alcaligenes faecalis TaxID=511 RepID=Q6WB87_ALCFA|nr:GntR family transcriptional regulator [Alcaligenes faecalis subsp. faecalis NCIB 8687]EJC61935.1 GntR family transcriptional regulator [Alcaligenes faecalis subsp. faecalis NCIB 8687]QBH19925.1 GntR family transcriptional regulator [Alcaligenes faecalis]WGQ35994.1 GntR family transcriptional regulator [Alcaligenes faecalis]